MNPLREHANRHQAAAALTPNPSRRTKHMVAAGDLVCCAFMTDVWCREVVTRALTAQAWAAMCAVSFIYVHGLLVEDEGTSAARNRIADLPAPTNLAAEILYE